MSYQVNQQPIILAQANNDSGFKLPDASAPSSNETEQPSGNTAITVSPEGLTNVTESSSRDMFIGLGVFLVLLVVYFFCRNAYANHLVAKRVSPATASSAGWLLFSGLSFVTAAIVLAFINSQRFLNVLVTAPLVTIGAVALIATFFVGRR